MICKRCGKEVDHYGFSVFEDIIICINCRNKEKEHPLYKEAKKKLDDEIFNKKNYKFTGIGLPNDLKENKNKL